MMRTKFTLMQFDDAADFLHGIRVLQHYSVTICEVYTPKHIPGIEAKLRIKNIQIRNSVLKYGCTGAAAISNLACYMFEYSRPTHVPGKFGFTMLVAILTMAVTFFLATRLFLKHTPKVITPRPNDNRYLIVANAQGVIPHNDITHLFQYTAAVEISSAVKNIVIS